MMADRRPAALAGLSRVRWSEKILDECFVSLKRDRPDLPASADLDAVRTVAEEHAANLRHPPMTVNQLLDGLEVVGLRRSVGEDSGDRQRRVISLKGTEAPKVTHRYGDEVSGRRSDPKAEE